LVGWLIHEFTAEQDTYPRVTQKGLNI